MGRRLVRSDFDASRAGFQMAQIALATTRDSLSAGSDAVPICEIAPITKRKRLMRISALAIMVAATVLAAAPARAQTYDPAYPVCIQTYDIGGSAIECRYTSLAQCDASASGRGAQCYANPYFGGAQAFAGPERRRSRRAR
jgi:Protein of unknown function (DUF3551)